MRFSFAAYLIAVIATLCGSVLADALSFTFNNVNLTATQLVNFSSAGTEFMNTACSDQCNSAISDFQSCGTNNECICNSTTAAQLFDCETCLYNALIEQNVKAPDAKVGSQPLLTAYTTGCNQALNTTLALQLKTPPGFDGPESLKLSTGVTVLAVGTAFIIASSGLYILWNLD